MCCLCHCREKPKGRPGWGPLPLSFSLLLLLGLASLGKDGKGHVGAEQCRKASDPSPPSGFSGKKKTFLVCRAASAAAMKVTSTFSAPLASVSLSAVVPTSFCTPVSSMQKNMAARSSQV